MGVIGLLLLQTTAPAEGQGLFEFFTESGPIAKLILGILALFSLVSWAIMLGKAFQISRAARQSREFLEAFHRSHRFSEVNALANRLRHSPLVGIFQAGYAEIDGQIKSAAQEGEGEAQPERRGYRITSLAALERTLERAAGIELRNVARWTPFLATTASASPFIGLFGTVWGIMVAFRDIGSSGSTSIVTVAPGIAEALINTAAGLGAAIPALIGYNFFAHSARQLRARMEDFVREFLNLAERNFT
jgi:biopolymer transport protein TolQ